MTEMVWASVARQAVSSSWKSAWSLRTNPRSKFPQRREPRRAIQPEQEIIRFWESGIGLRESVGLLEMRMCLVVGRRFLVVG